MVGSLNVHRRNKLPKLPHNRVEFICVPWLYYLAKQYIHFCIWLFHVYFIYVNEMEIILILGRVRSSGPFVSFRYLTDCNNVHALLKSCVCIVLCKRVKINLSCHWFLVTLAEVSDQIEVWRGSEKGLVNYGKRTSTYIRSDVHLAIVSFSLDFCSSQLQELFSICILWHCPMGI